MTRFQFPVRNLPMPIQELATEMEHMVDRLFQKPGANYDSNSCNSQELSYAPCMDVSENETAYSIELDLPGVKVEDVKIEIHEDRLSISGTRKTIAKSEGTQFHRDERGFGPFRRTLVLPKSVDVEQVEATYNDGVLQVSVPKIAKAQPRTILIKTNSTNTVNAEESSGSHS